MLAGGIELQRTAFLRQIDLLKPGKTGFVFIMTGAGILVDHPDRTRLMQHIHQRPGINNATKMAGRSLAEVFGAEACVLAKPHLEAAFDGQAVTYESRTALAGRARILETTYVPDMQADGNVAGVYALAHDTTRMKEVEEKLIQLTRVDSLTGIANRHMFVEALHLAIERARRSGAPMALAYLDIDHFKAINDTHGHALGDDALKEFAPRLSVDVRATDTVARLSGDEFVIIFEDLNSEQEVTAAAAKIIDGCGRRSRRATCGWPSPPASASRCFAARARAVRSCWPTPTARCTRPSATAATASACTAGGRAPLQKSPHIARFTASQLSQPDWVGLWRFALVPVAGRF
jgi:GGDEF domain-containing protein